MQDFKGILSFDPFQVDLGSQCLRQGSQAIDLRPKTWEVLRYLLARAGELVTKGEILDEVWRDTVVSEGTLTQSIRELRAALDDDPKRPKFIVTVHRRGYRWVAPVQTNAIRATTRRDDTAILVGREDEVRTLRQALLDAVAGQRRTVFVSGVAGIGKTALIENFIRCSATMDGGGTVIARGQCVEQRGEAEPYLPVLETLDDLCRGPIGSLAMEVLSRFAPTWLVQLPWLLSAAELDALQRRLMGTGPERMLREFCAATAELARHKPLALVLEDLHWCDAASVDLLAALARRRDPAPLLVVGSLRPIGSAGEEHPFATLLPELTSRGEALELPLRELSPTATQQYVANRLNGHPPAALLDAINRYSGGSPLFLVTALGYALSAGWVTKRDSDGGIVQLAVDAETVERGISDGLRRLIEVQVNALDTSDRELLQAAGVAGVAFSPSSLVVATGLPASELDVAFARLSRQLRIIRLAASNERSRDVTRIRYEFAHALYQRLLYEGTEPERRVQLHLDVARGLEIEHGERASEHAADLAMHYERGGKIEQAAHYLGLAALNAHNRVADREAEVLLGKALTLIGQMPDSPRRQRREADLCIQLGAVRGSVYGRGADQYLPPFLRAWDLSVELDDVPRMFLARMACFGHFCLTEQMRRGEEVCHDLLALAARVPMPDIIAVAHAAMGSVMVGMGRFPEARQHLEKALATLNPHDPATQLYRRLEDPEILCLTGLSWTLAQLGYPDQAHEQMARVIAVGESRAPYHHVYCLNAAAILEQTLDDAAACLQYAEATLEMAREHGFDPFVPNAEMLRAWAQERLQPRAGGWHRLEEALANYRRGTQRFGLVAHQAAVAEACLAEGVLDKGFATIAAAEALMETSGERAPRATLLRLKALLLDASAQPAAQIEQCFRDAQTAAQDSGSRLTELRTCNAFGAWLIGRGEADRGRARIEPAYRWFSEGFDSPDLRRAAELLEEVR